MTPIFFHEEDRKYPVISHSLTSEWLISVALAEKHQISELNYILCSDDYLLNMNKAYLNHDYYTDVITFDNRVSDNAILGDVFMSWDRIQDNASHFEVKETEELFRVMVHGLLHLVGYGDKSPEESQLMKKKENTYLSLRKK